MPLSREEFEAKAQKDPLAALLEGATGEERERIIAKGFWKKLRRAAGHIPFAEDAVAAWYCARDTKTPPHVRATLIGALAYFVIPADFLPDVILAFGFTDDATVLATALALVSGHIKDAHRAAARAALLREGENAGEEGSA
ncbi:MAG: DUF1232 domain-containing protein [Alphaproteobacteria bacterium]|nr:DUF1232 domain-containing protein [Alphaproteobacteria bacterium]